RRAPARRHRPGPPRGRGVEPRLPSRDPGVRAADRHRRSAQHVLQPSRRAAGRLACRRARHVRALGPAAPGAGSVPDLEEVAQRPTRCHRRRAMLSEFKAFIMRGNVVDLAVGIVIGAAFTTVVNSFVNDLLMPPIGLALGKVDFANLFVSLTGQPFPSVAAAKAAGAPTLNYGMFINNVI